MADPRDKRLWTCDKCGAETVGSVEHVFSDDIMSWYCHDGGEDENGAPRDALILCGFCQPLDVPTEAS